MWMMPLHLHVNQKSDYDDDDICYTQIFRGLNVFQSLLMQSVVMNDLSPIILNYLFVIGGWTDRRTGGMNGQGSV